MGHQRVFIIIPAHINADEAEYYTKSILQQYIRMNEQYVSFAKLKEIFDDIKCGKITEFSQLLSECGFDKKNIYNDHAMRNVSKFPIRWKWYDDIEKVDRNAALENQVYYPKYTNIIIDENGQYHEFNRGDRSNEAFLERPEIKDLTFYEAWMKI